jgi:hypothetical protein
MTLNVQRTFPPALLRHKQSRFALISFSIHKQRGDNYLGVSHQTA